MSDLGIPSGPILPPDLFEAASAGAQRALAAAGAGRGAGAAETLPEAGPCEDAVRAAKDFESILLYRMMEEMRRTIPESGLLETGGSDQVQGLFWFYLAQAAGEQGGLGLWKQLVEQFVPTGGEPAGPSRGGDTP